MPPSLCILGPGRAARMPSVHPPTPGLSPSRDRALTRPGGAAGMSLVSRWGRGPQLPLEPDDGTGEGGPRGQEEPDDGMGECGLRGQAVGIGSPL